MDDDSGENDTTLPTFSGNVMPLNICLENDEDNNDETTRRVGFTPSLPSFGTSTIDALAPPGFRGSSISTLSSKQTSLAFPLLSKASTTSVIAWNLKGAPNVPPFGNPLEPTSVFVPHITATIMSNRVSSILQERNIQAEYERNEAECLTLDNVEFSVFLYSGKEEYSHGIIVEVQRFNGSSAAFYEDSRAILDAAQDKKSPTTKKSKSSLLLDDDEFDEDSSQVASLDFALKMLQGMTDVQLLGLQMLTSMTGEKRIGKMTASNTSIMMVQTGSEVLQMVFEVFKSTDEPSLLMQVMILLSNIASCTTLPLENIKRKLITLLNSNKPQMALLAAKCFAIHQIDSDVAKALQNAKKLGQEKNYSDLYTLSNGLLQNYT